MTETTDRKRLRFFEQLGAPSLLFRNVDAYQDVVTPNNISDDFGPSTTEAFWENRERRSRAHARLYYHQREKPSTIPLKTTPSVNKKIGNTQRRERARRHLSLWMKKDFEHLVNENQDYDAKEVNLYKKRLASVHRYESAYLRSHLIGSKPNMNRGIRRAMLDFSVFLAGMRRQYADPVYMAPLPKDEDYQKLNGIEVKRGVGRRIYPHPFGSNHPNRPSIHGNCLTCFHCSCSRCRGHKDPTICIIHPVGEALDHLRLSFIALPTGLHRQNLPESLEEGPTMQLNVDETIRELRQCGDSTYIVRTDLFCVFVQVTLDEQETHGNSICGSWFQLSLLHRVDLRSLSKFSQSYVPSSVACHPKYGSGFSNPRCAILSACQKTGDRVTVHLAQCGDQEVPITKHRFNNLHDISLIEFTMSHPMVFWSAARSHVHPMPKANIASQDLLLGYGTALFCLDARSQQAIFQWSPSREEFLAEGVHGLSGIYVDDKIPHSLWVSSTSAGKVWEIDSRMPSSPRTTWSLAHACDGLGVVLPPTGQYGAGHLFSRPITTSFYDKEVQERYKPLFSVSQDPGAFSLHVYQRPLFRPRFETRPLECIADPNLALMNGFSASSSSIFRLPDVSDKTFTTGLVSFHVSPKNLLSFSDLVRIGYADMNEIDAFCAMTMTNRGDLYAQTIVDGVSRESSAKLNPECPVGGGFISLPEQAIYSHRNSHTVALRLSNDAPTPGSAFTLPAINHNMRSLATSSLGTQELISMLSPDDETLKEMFLDGETIIETERLPSLVDVDQAKVSFDVQLPSSIVDEAKEQMIEIEQNNFLRFQLQDFDRKEAGTRSDMTFNAIDKVSKMLQNWKDFESYDDI